MAVPLIERIRSHPHTPLVLVVSVAIGSLAVNLYGLLMGITIVVSHLLYVPIILAGFYYPRRGVTFAIGISVIYFMMVAVTRSGFPEDLISAAARCVVFIVIAFVVSYLSQQLKEKEVVLKRKNNELNAANEQLAVIEQELRSNLDELTKSQQALHQANNKLNILSSVTRHDILNQITAMLAYLEFSQKLTKDPALLEYINKEVEIIGAIQRQIEFTRCYQDIGVHSPKWHELASTIKLVAAELPLSGISLQVSLECISIYADPLIEKVFYNLIENGIRHGEDVTAITFTARDFDDRLTIVYEDDGIGVPADNKEKIFFRGFGKHTGLGLFLIREILSITGITITETGEYGKGARFEIHVPKGMYRISSAETKTG